MYKTKLEREAGLEGYRVIIADIEGRKKRYQRDIEEIEINIDERHWVYGIYFFKLNILNLFYYLWISLT